MSGKLPSVWETSSCQKLKVTLKKGHPSFSSMDRGLLEVSRSSPGREVASSPKGLPCLSIWRMLGKVTPSAQCRMPLLTLSYVYLTREQPPPPSTAPRTPPPSCLPPNKA